jgi:hypothetical protein
MPTPATRPPPGGPGCGEAPQPPPGPRGRVAGWSSPCEKRQQSNRDGNWRHRTPNTTARHVPSAPVPSPASSFATQAGPAGPPGRPGLRPWPGLLAMPAQAGRGLPAPSRPPARGGASPPAAPYALNAELLAAAELRGCQEFHPPAGGGGTPPPPETPPQQTNTPHAPTRSTLPLTAPRRRPKAPTNRSSKVSRFLPLFLFCYAGRAGRPSGPAGPAALARPACHARPGGPGPPCPVPPPCSRGGVPPRCALMPTAQGCWHPRNSAAASSTHPPHGGGATTPPPLKPPPNQNRRHSHRDGPRHNGRQPQHPSPAKPRRLPPSERQHPSGPHPCGPEETPGAPRPTARRAQGRKERGGNRNAPAVRVPRVGPPAGRSARRPAAKSAAGCGPPRTDAAKPRGRARREDAAGDPPRPQDSAEAAGAGRCAPSGLAATGACAPGPHRSAGPARAQDLLVPSPSMASRPRARRANAPHSQRPTTTQTHTPPQRPPRPQQTHTARSVAPPPTRQRPYLHQC